MENIVYMDKKRDTSLKQQRFEYKKKNKHVTPPATSEEAHRQKMLKLAQKLR